MSKFFDKLKRRNVIKASIAYLVANWVLFKINNRLNILIGSIISIVFSFINESLPYIIYKYTPGLLIDKFIIVLSFDDISSERDSQWFCVGFQKMFYLEIKPYKL